MTGKPLSDKEQACLEHLKRAEELGVNLKEYAEAYGLDVKTLYQGKRQLSRKGMRGLTDDDTAGDFVTVRLAESSTFCVCRLTHASGWTLDCHEWPSPEWLSTLVGGTLDAP